MESISLTELKRMRAADVKEQGSREITSDGESIGILVIPTTDFFRGSAIHIGEQSDAQK